VLRAIRHGDRPIIPNEHCTEYSLALKTTFKRAWSSDPSLRPTAQEFLRRIRKEQNNEGDDEDDSLEVEIPEGEDEDSEKEIILDQLRALLADSSSETEEKELIVDVGDSAAILREIKTRERSQSVEEVSVVEVKEAARVGSITCLLRAGEYVTLSRRFRGTESPIVVGGTSKGYLLCWNEKVCKDIKGPC